MVTVTTRSSDRDKASHEDGAFAGLCAALTAAGRPARVVEHPDRDLGATLTVDAILDIAGQRWAVDHCLLSRASTLQTSMIVADATLRDHLQAIATRFGVGLHVAYMPQLVDPDRRKRKAAGLGIYYRDLLARAEQAARTGAGYVGDDGMAQVRVISHEEGRDGPPPVVLTPFTNTTGSIFIGNEVIAGLRAPLTKKIDHQFLPARALGLRTMLLLDQIPRPGSHTVWMASPHLVASTVTTILVEADAVGVLDEVWLRQPPERGGQPHVSQVLPGR